MTNQDPSLPSPQDLDSDKHISFDESQKATAGNSTTEDEQSATKEAWKEMKDERMNNDRDPILQAPQEANTGKHINFLDIDEPGNHETKAENIEEQSATKEAWKEMKDERMNNDQPV